MTATQPSGARPSWTMLLLCVAILCASQFATADDVADVQSARAWQFRVFADRLPAVDDIAVKHNGDVYATQNLPDGKGRVVRLRGGKVELVAGKLEQPGGVLVTKDTLYVTEQVNDGRVIEINLVDNRRRAIENLSNPEHLARLPGGDLAVTENGVIGRLTRLMRNGAVEVITSGLNSPQGLSVSRDGTIYVGESDTGRVLAFKDGAMNVVIDDLDELGQIEVSPDGALWITEIGSPGRLLRLKNGSLETILSGLKYPRGIAAMDSGAVLVAEQGRERILQVEPKP